LDFKAAVGAWWAVADQLVLSITPYDKAIMASHADAITKKMASIQRPQIMECPSPNMKHVAH
jgi:hypothetical protein